MYSFVAFKNCRCNEEFKMEAQGFGGGSVVIYG